MEKKKYLSIKQWAGKAEKLCAIFNLKPGMLSAEIKYHHFNHEHNGTESRQVVYNLYFSHLKGLAGHSDGEDWEEVYDNMFKKLSEHRANQLVTDVV